MDPNMQNVMYVCNIFMYLYVINSASNIWDSIH